MKNLIVILGLFFSMMIFSQEGKILKIEEVVEEEEEISNVPFSVVEQVPIHPGCEGDNDAKKKCFSEKITKMVRERFNISISNELGYDTGKVVRVYGRFIITKEGDVAQVHAKAPHPMLKAETIRVIKLIPKMTPGKQKNKNVSVTFTLPIIFKVPKKTKEKK